jgi:ADP-heptose:LPS heptosyltransferase
MTAGLEEKKENILAARFGGLGDLLITLPSIQLIKKKRPQTQITLVARQSYGLFLKEAKVIETLLPRRLMRPAFYFRQGKKYLA